MAHDIKFFSGWRPHPWHGLNAGKDAPDIVTAYIEMTPFDVVKYEVDKRTGYLSVDRPQAGASSPPSLYGFIPRTYCGNHVAELCSDAETADHDPLDICVISERPINRTEVILSARVVGGLEMIDGGEADDKIIAVLHNDHVWGTANDISDIPHALVQRMRHYFSTYKHLPGDENQTKIDLVYGREHAHKVIKAAMKDYREVFET